MKQSPHIKHKLSVTEMSQNLTTFTTAFGTMTIVWQDIETTPVQHIFLSHQKTPSEKRARKTFPLAKNQTSPRIDNFVADLQSNLQGNSVSFDLSLLQWSQCSKTQQRILRAEAGIPRGWISTYKRIAHHVGIKNGARVVGNALARNPFPVIIPCHRAIKSDGSLGGYQGGPAMKRKLLENEGIEFSSSGKVVMKTVYY